MSVKLHLVLKCAVIAALYAALTFVVPWSSGLMQIRLSEALCVLPFLLPDAAYGLFIGCALGNLLSGGIAVDVVFGSLATLAAGLLTALIAKLKLSHWFAPLPAVVLNALVVGAVLCYGYEVGAPYWTCALYVGAGQLIACYALGMPLLFALRRLPEGLVR
ncbi:MAG: QueT transporter family protein [Clostridia bacterium]|nr:QueT transporter family protein [Clostridia bacterium]